MSLLKSLSRRRLGLILGIGIFVVIAGRLDRIVTQRGLPPADSVAAGGALQEEDVFQGARGWINSKPLRLADLRGKIVLLDFWTYCCINCHHVLPDLAKLEQKYKNALVVIGVHTAKFDAERNTENIRKKVAEYRIRHPVANDADQVIWNRVGANSWPTLVLIDPAGNLVGKASGEGNYEILDNAIAKLVAVHKAKGDLDERPVTFFSESDKPHDEALYFPGKILADQAGNRLFISDTDHNRIVVTDLKGAFLDAIGNGQEGRTNGSYERATFNRPQGLCLLDGKLYVADTENHEIRAVDLDAKRVTTVAGTGVQSHRHSGSGPAKETGLNSPWDLLPLPGTKSLAIAMAGPHQIWRLDLESGVVGILAGSGEENIRDGSFSSAAFAQPSGLATDGKHLFVADSEVSGVRLLSFANKRVTTIAGVGLFGFGDVDGRGSSVRLQHCLGLAFGDGKLYIADTYNNKVKVCDPTTKAVQTFAGTGKAGDGDTPAEFYQPGGVSLAGKTLYVADTNNHAIRTIDVASGRVGTLKLQGVKPPAPPRRAPNFPNAKVINAPEAEVAPGKAFTLSVTPPLPEGFHLNEEAPIRYVVEIPGHADALDASEVSPSGATISPPKSPFEVAVPLAATARSGETMKLKLSVQTFVCKATYCTVFNYVWNVPVRFADGGNTSVALGAAGKDSEKAAP
jgi:thiol-disulfide isomerase/thioredoxin